jgi:hypothetical protein
MVAGRVGKRRPRVNRCSVRVLSGSFRFATGGGGRTTVSRGRLVYATGVRIELRRGSYELLMAKTRPLRRGRYTLALRERRRRHVVVRREQISIG